MKRLLLILLTILTTLPIYSQEETKNEVLMNGQPIDMYFDEIHQLHYADSLSQEGFYMQALEVLDSVKQKKQDSEYKLDESYFTRRQLIHARIKEWREMIAVGEEYLNTYNTSGQLTNLALIYSNMGMGYLNLNEYNEAIRYYEKQLLIYTRLNESNSVCTSYCNLGGAYLEKGDKSLAHDYYKKGLNLFLELAGITRKTLINKHFEIDSDSQFMRVADLMGFHLYQMAIIAQDYYKDRNLMKEYLSMGMHLGNKFCSDGYNKVFGR